MLGHNKSYRMKRDKLTFEFNIALPVISFQTHASIRLVNVGGVGQNLVCC